jgi:serine/threonine-protein kinase RsbW
MSREDFRNIEGEGGKEESEWSFESTPEKALEVADAVEARLTQLGWSEEQLGNFKLAIHEAMVNAVVHGNEGDPAKKVNVELSMTKDADGEEMAEVTVVDEGKGFDPSQVPNPTRAEGLMEGHGRGRFFMKVFTDSEPEFFEGQGKVILRRKKNRPQETDTIG